VNKKMLFKTMLAIEQQSPAVKQIKPFLLNLKKRLLKSSIY